MIELDREIPPKFQQVNNIEFLNSTISVLDNGVNVNLLSGGTQDILKIDFIFQAGTYHQSQPLIARATNQLLQQGSKNYTAFEIAEGIDQYGAFLQAETSYDTSTITLYSLSKHLQQVLPYLSELILHPTFPEKEFHIYKNNSLERFKINQEKVGFVARQRFIQHLFGKNHPYGFAAAFNNYEDLSLTEIKTFYKNYYALNNAQIIVSGNISDDVLPLLNNFFGKESCSNPAEQKVIDVNVAPETKTNVFIEKEGALQSAIRIGRQFPNKLHPDYFGLQILNTVLGGYFGSRLMKNIREDKGYTYGIGSGIVSLKNGGYFFISTEVGSDVTSKALAEIYKEMEILSTKEIPEQELGLVKNYLLGQLLKSCDGPFNMASLYENVLLYGLDYTFYENYINTIKGITSKTLLNLAQTYLNKSELKEVVVGKI